MIQDAIDDLDKADPKYYIKMGETMERFAIEASMAKVYGSETSDMVADNCLQIFGGYGFIEEYPIAMAYRDDRINRIWEGTNEINRAIISGYMMKKVLTEEISLRDFLKDLNTFIAADVQANSQDNFAIEKHAVQATKKLAVLLFQEALCEFGQDLKHEQQLSEAFADIFTHIYTSESVICRVQQTLSSNGTSNMPVNIAKINVAESLLEVRSLSAKCLNRIFSENVPTSIMRSVTKLHDIINLDTDTISLKKDLGEFMIDRKDYPF